MRLGWRANGAVGGLLWPSSFLIPVTRVYGGLVVPKDVTLFGLLYFDASKYPNIFVSES